MTLRQAKIRLNSPGYIYYSVYCFCVSEAGKPPDAHLPIDTVKIVVL